jgi:protein-disulfide isomerase
MEQMMRRWQVRWLGGCLVAGLVATTATAGVWAQEDTAKAELPTDQIEAIVRAYMLREPQIVYEALQELQRRETAAEETRRKEALASNRDMLFRRDATPVGGNPDGDVTLVEFFDYRCGYCRRVVGSLQALVDRDEELRVAFKEFPILGEDSVRAARAALAAERQGLYMPFHFALMAADDLSMDGIMQVAAGVGLDTDQLASDMQLPEIQAEITANYALARELGIEGTPAFVIGDNLVPGAVTEERLTALIDEARTNCAAC